MLVWTPLRKGAELCCCEHSWGRAQSYVGVDTAERGGRVMLVWTKLGKGAELYWCGHS